jgi:hypothetical protein
LNSEIFSKRKKKQSKKKEKKNKIKPGGAKMQGCPGTCKSLEGTNLFLFRDTCRGLAFYQRAGMCGDRLNWFSFLVFGENIST